MVTRTFVRESGLADDGLELALAPALTPAGPLATPSFFHGFAVRPQVLARGLVTLADVTATRYFQYTPADLRDPVLTAHGDRLRAECFSACNGVYARLDLLGQGFDGGEIAHGTTNVDIGMTTRSALSNVGSTQLLHLDIGHDGLTVSTLRETAAERPVAMPDRWVRALGNVAELHRGLVPSLELTAMEARGFIASLPPVTAKPTAGWLTRVGARVKFAARRGGTAVYVNGPHRLGAVKRLLPHLEGLTVYGPADHGPGPVAVEARLPAARLVLGLTAEPWRGHSGEGALLPALAEPTVLADAELIAALLAFEPVINVPRLAREGAIEPSRVRSALAVLATSGRVGWDLHDRAYFHRELPDDPDRVAKDNPRLTAARRLVATRAVTPATGDGRDASEWIVHSHGPDGTVDYRVGLDPGADPDEPSRGARCTCAWFLKHAGDRGPCKHVLAVHLHVKDHP